MLNYHALVAGRTLEDIQGAAGADAFSEVLWTLNETEHGGAGPERLYGFDALVGHAARTAEADEAIIVPFLLRYLWQVTYADYTRAAWRALQAVVEDREALADIAYEVLTTHPHGALRAEVLFMDDRGEPEYLQEPRFEQVMMSLMGGDPSPQVRSMVVAEFALQWLEFSDRLAGVTPEGLEQVLYGQLVTDAAAEVREAIFVTLVAARRVRAEALLAALRAESNTTILPRITHHFARAVVSGLRVGAQPVADLIDLVAAQRGHRQFADILGCLGWYVHGAGVVGSAAEMDWLAAAPFRTGPALIAHFQARFADAGQAPMVRAFALRGLDKEHGALPDAAVVDFILDAPQTGASLALLIGAYNVFHRLFQIPFPGVATRAGKLRAMLVKSLSLSVDDIAEGAPFRQRIIDLALRQAVSSGDQDLMDTALAAVETDTGWMGSAFTGFEREETRLSLAGLMRVAMSGRQRDNAEAAAQCIAKRYGRFGDAESLGWLEQLLTTWTDVAALAGVVRELPARGTLADRRGHEVRLVAAVKVAAGRPLANLYDDYKKSLITDWLG